MFAKHKFAVSTASSSWPWSRFERIAVATTPITQTLTGCPRIERSEPVSSSAGRLKKKQMQNATSTSGRPYNPGTKSIGRM